MGKKRSRRRVSMLPLRRTSPGAVPGTVQVDPEAPAPVMSVIAFGPEDLLEEPITEVSRLTELMKSHSVVWLNVDGLGDASSLNALGAALGLHPLALEDVVNAHQRPKLEEYDDHIYFVMRMAPWGGAEVTEQLSLFLGDRWVLSLQEEAGDCFDPVRERLRRSRGRIRGSTADYLAYALIDAAVDDYFPVLEKLSDELDALEQETLEGQPQDVPRKLVAKRHQLLALKRTLWPLREALNALRRDDTPLVNAPTRVYLRDCADHVVQLLDLIESHREVVNSLMDVHNSAVSKSMNEVMKVLTIIATLFIPLTFISSIYGMNFDPDRSPWNMPELRWAFGYPFALGLMLVTALALLHYFRRKGWLGGR